MVLPKTLVLLGTLSDGNLQYFVLGFYIKPLKVPSEGYLKNPERVLFSIQKIVWVLESSLWSADHKFVKTHTTHFYKRLRLGPGDRISSHNISYEFICVKPEKRIKTTF